MFSNNQVCKKALWTPERFPTGTEKYSKLTEKAENSCDPIGDLMKLQSDYWGITDRSSTVQG